MKNSIFLLFLLFFTGCGGGGGSVAPIPLISEAGENQTVHIGDSVQVDARDSINDPDRRYFFEWEITTKPTGSTATLFPSLTAMNPSFTIDKLGTYTLTLKVGDGTGATALDTVTITAENTAPTASDFTLTLDINQSNTSTNWKSAASVVDGDGDTLSTSIITQGTKGTFTITGDTITYLKSTETNSSDIGAMSISDGYSTQTISITVNSLYFKELSSSRDFTVAIKSDGTLWAWGSNKYGQLGDGTNGDKLVPTQESTHSSNWSSVTAGAEHTIAVKSDGTLWSWGGNKYAQLGDGTTDDKNTPTQENTNATNWSSASAGTGHSLALKSDGTLWAWGTNGYGQLGDGTTTYKNTPTQESSGETNWKTISAGDYHSLALKNNGTLWAWGYNNIGQLGDGTTVYKNTPTQENSNSDNWKTIAAGNYHSLALKNNETLWAWGDNSYGQLGDNTYVNKNTPTQESSNSNNWIKISASYSHSFAIKDDNTLWSWGKNDYNQRGDADSRTRNTPLQITTTQDWAKIVASKTHSLALKNNGTLWAWGFNGFGQFGNGTYDNRFVPTKLYDLITWKQVVTSYLHTLGLKSDRTLWGWGYNAFGQLGDGTNIDKIEPTQESTSATDWTKIATGNNHSIALKTNGTLWAWGANHDGQLGNGTNDSKNEPTQESSNGTTWNQISCGRSFTVALKSDGTLWSWGANNRGQLGDGTNTDKNIPTRESSNGTTWSQISGGGNHVLAIKDGSALWSWGANNDGQLGNGTTIDRNTPSRETTNSFWGSISSGGSHSIAIKDDATLWGWGNNYSGQLGDGTTNDKNIPTQESTVANNWAMAIAGNSYTVALKHNFSLWSWGFNNQGQLGNYNHSSQPTPTQITLNTPLITYPISLDAGQFNSSMVTADEILWVWGDNQNHQLGIEWNATTPTLIIMRE